MIEWKNDSREDKLGRLYTVKEKIHIIMLKHVKILVCEDLEVINK